MIPETAVSSVIAAVAALTWGALLIRTVTTYASRHFHHKVFLVMPLVGFLASVGMLSSSVAMLAVLLGYRIPTDAFAVVAGLGRGALLMGGIIAWSYYRLPERDAA